MLGLAEGDGEDGEERLNLDEFEGDFDFMEVTGTRMLEVEGHDEAVPRSLDSDIRYRYLIADVDITSHALILDEQPYREGFRVEKKDCIGHVQKRMGSALHDLNDGLTSGWIYTAHFFEGDRSGIGQAWLVP